MNERRSTDYNLQFTEDRLAGLYDVFYPPARRDDFAFYLPMVMSAGAVLDVGCGIGALLHHARASGHRGRLCGRLCEWHGDLGRVRGDRFGNLDWRIRRWRSRGYLGGGRKAGPKEDENKSDGVTAHEKRVRPAQPAKVPA